MIQHDNSRSVGILPPSSPIPIANESAASYANDDFDDVFGSAPSSPSHHHHDEGIRSGNLEPSDIPRLREKHGTEGYRDGVTEGKGESVQAGFDEGYGLGAVLGLKIGWILGVLEGVRRGLEGDGEGFLEQRERVGKLLEGARRELDTVSVFGKDFWGEDGIWKFEVGDGQGEVLFPDVAAAHPLVKKWHGVVEGEVRRWGLDLGIMDGEDGREEVDESGGKGAHERDARKGEVESEPVAEGMAKALGVTKKDLSW
ncbi:uncharacterized protein RSE6_14847 [Rhynchosporium secalis]|uniref:Protein YAE1 n=1 Tax=Rhynchosporium secalis TaxID=38038 RepID=A0A1E1MW94_RHYSE|nr:uncharacterized protein RSE6_14847 [Rhynchosporium secalis]